MKLRIALAAGAVLTFAAGFAGSGSAVEGIGVPAQIVDVAKETAIQAHPTTDDGSRRRPSTIAWGRHSGAS